MTKRQMGQKLDKLAREIQDSILEGYSERFRREFLNPKNIGNIEDPDCHVSITGVCGDNIEMSLSIKNGRISDIKFMREQKQDQLREQKQDGSCQDEGVLKANDDVDPDRGRVSLRIKELLFGSGRAFSSRNKECRHIFFAEKKICVLSR